MNLPHLPSLTLNLGILSFFRRNMFVIFIIIWVIVVGGTIGFIYINIKSQIDAPIPTHQGVEFKLDKLNAELFSSKLFLNLRTLATSPGQSDYSKCLGVPGRPNIFTPFVPCQ